MKTCQSTEYYPVLDVTGFVLPPSVMGHRALPSWNDSSPRQAIRKDSLLVISEGFMPL